jgi:integrase
MGCYSLKQIQEYLGHADLATTARYIKNLPVPRGTTERAKLEAYLDAETGVRRAVKGGQECQHRCRQ